MNYTVNVAASGAYVAQIRVASPGGGGSLHVGFNRSAGSWTQAGIPATGGWQTWTTVNIPLNLTAGAQQMTLFFDTAGYNVSYVSIAANAPPPQQPQAPAGAGGRFRMMTWNINSGKDVSNNYGLLNQVQLIASQNPDVVVLQEVQTWDEYQPTRIPALLQQVTGQTWYSAWAPSPACAVGGCIGELIVSRLPIAASNYTYLEVSDAGRALVYVAGVPINILTNHLEYYDTGLRSTELNELMAWARNFGGPRLVGGDFNSWWGEWWITQMETEYHDTWFDVSGTRDGAYTKGNVRFDYIFRAFDGDWRVVPTNAWVVGTSLSDHQPFVADYRVQ
jgi:endonuclease/exonuclease/phosphatase family metal-dependent hydrolase